MASHKCSELEVKVDVNEVPAADRLARMLDESMGREQKTAEAFTSALLKATTELTHLRERAAWLEERCGRFEEWIPTCTTLRLTGYTPHISEVSMDGPDDSPQVTIGFLNDSLIPIGVLVVDRHSVHWLISILEGFRTQGINLESCKALIDRCGIKEPDKDA